MEVEGDVVHKEVGGVQVQGLKEERLDSSGVFPGQGGFFLVIAAGKARGVEFRAQDVDVGRRGRLDPSSDPRPARAPDQVGRNLRGQVHHHQGARFAEGRGMEQMPGQGGLSAVHLTDDEREAAANPFRVGISVMGPPSVPPDEQAAQKDGGQCGSRIPDSQPARRRLRSALSGKAAGFHGQSQVIGQNEGLEQQGDDQGGEVADVARSESKVDAAGRLGVADVADFRPMRGTYRMAVVSMKTKT